MTNGDDEDPGEPALPATAPTAAAIGDDVGPMLRGFRLGRDGARRDSIALPLRSLGAVMEAPPSAPAEQPRVTKPHASPATEQRLYLDEKEMCAELGISPVTASKWRRQAMGPPFTRLGRAIRYPRAALQTWLASQTVGAPQRPK